MNLHPSDRHTSGSVVIRSGAPVRRARAIRQVGIRRLGEPQRGMLASSPRPTIDAHAIEEAITRFLEINPPQLYRGGA